MNYEETINYIHNTPKFSRILGNELLKKLLKRLGNPEKELRFVHIAGTNGKGSTAAMISSVLTSAGYSTGLFTSPYIERFNERIQISGECISDNELACIVSHIKNIMETHECFVSEFALDLAAALIYFKSRKCDIVVLETGLGGKLDATNVIEKSISVITSVSLDHTEYLGDTIEKITLDKAEIIKPDGYTILYSQNKESVKDIIKKKCESVGSQLYISDSPVIKANGILSCKGMDIHVPLAGNYQFFNAMTAIKTIEILQKEGFSISAKNISEGISKVKWPVRFEYLSDKLIVDGAHNPDAVEKLCVSLSALNIDILPVIAMMKDKATDECAGIISRFFKNAVATQIDIPRCISCEELKNKLSANGVNAMSIKSPYDAVSHAIQTGKTVCVFGSLYLAGRIRTHFLKK